MAQKSKKVANRWKGDVKDPSATSGSPSEPIEYEVDKILWWQEKITELTLRGVTDASYKAFALLPPQFKQSALWELEKVIQNQIERMSILERDEYVRELERIESDKWYEIYTMGANIKNICWIGAKTWGCSFGNYAIVSAHAEQKAPKSLAEMKFKHTNDFEAFLDKNERLDLCLNVSDAPYVHCMDFCSIRKLGTEANVRCFTYNCGMYDNAAHIGARIVHCKRYV